MISCHDVLAAVCVCNVDKVSDQAGAEEWFHAMMYWQQFVSVMWTRWVTKQEQRNDFMSWCTGSSRHFSRADHQPCCVWVTRLTMMKVIIRLLWCYSNATTTLTLSILARTLQAAREEGGEGVFFQGHFASDTTDHSVECKMDTEICHFQMGNTRAPI